MITEQRAPARPAVKGAHYMYGLDLLRVICAATVVYTHVAGWMRANDQGFFLVDLVEGGLVAPLHLSERLGFVGVCAFLLITGVVVTHVSFSETSGQFLARRAVRLLPTMWSVVVLGWLLAQADLIGTSRVPDLGDLVLNLFLLTGSTPGAVAVLGVLWTLVMQVVFYLFTAATLPLLRRWPWLPPAIGASVISVLISFTADGATAPMHQLRLVATFVPVIFIGQLIMLVRAGKVTPLVGIALGGVHFWLGVRSNLTWLDAPRADTYARTLLLLVLVLVLLTRADGRIARSRVVGVIAQRTYAIFLLHIPVLFAILTLTSDHIGFLPALVLGFIVLVAAVEVLWRGVEGPINRAYRRWEARRVGRRMAARSGEQRRSLP